MARFTVVRPFRLRRFSCGPHFSMYTDTHIFPTLSRAEMGNAALQSNLRVLLGRVGRNLADPLQQQCAHSIDCSVGLPVPRKSELFR